ncbi:hypothetical protein T4C_11320 [Trichinella pseudospiralis]|uniref:Uncharacterized protein n=1 Tax=Trichinella pseudospiralis TaxID=6337 RepID=A0A0V1IIG6_TRIPS|nr:hypothetical protein T4C_11320 [Trichinella pseudospiralis]
MPSGIEAGQAAQTGIEAGQREIYRSSKRHPRSLFDHAPHFLNYSMEKNLTNNEERWRLYANWEQEACNKLLRKMRKRNFFLCASLVNQPWKADKSVILAFVVPSQRKACLVHIESSKLLVFYEAESFVVFSKETRPKEAWQFDSLDESSWPTSECCPRQEQCVLDSMAESGSLPRSLVYYMKKRTFLIRLKAGNQLTYLLKIAI